MCLRSCLLLWMSVAGVLWCSAQGNAGRGLMLDTENGHLWIEPVTDGIVRVASSPDSGFFQRKSFMRDWEHVPPAPVWSSEQTGEIVSVKTRQLRADINQKTGRVSFYDVSGNLILAEREGGRTWAPSDAASGYLSISQQWEGTPDEGLYGMGEHHLGITDIRHADLDLWQHNGTAALPFFVSTRDYGILWDSDSYTRFGDLREATSAFPGKLYSANGDANVLSVTYYADGDFVKPLFQETTRQIDITDGGVQTDAAKRARIHEGLPEKGPLSVRWQGFVEPNQTGDFSLQTFSAGLIQVWLDGQKVIDNWHQKWLPWKDVATLRLKAGQRHSLRINWVCDQNAPLIQVAWKTPNPDSDAITVWSEAERGVDYYFVYGSTPDQVISGYRTLTGQAPMMPVWAFGLWQSRQRYKTAEEALDVVSTFREHEIPFDNIVQDWQYWKPDEWGSHGFDPGRFPDPDGWIKSIHEAHARLMISVWPKFYPGTTNFEQMKAGGYLYSRNLDEDIRDWLGYPYTFYDTFNDEGRSLFWKQMKTDLWVKGIDAWWMDASEPDLLPSTTLQGLKDYMGETAAGPAAAVLNAYPLLNSKAVYEGQREAAPDQRVFILTRSGFAGSQRYASAIWSGDITSTWTAMKKQIAAGVGFSASGLPYWTMDAGGFSVPSRFARKNPTEDAKAEWAELCTRWFQFGAFTPLMRVHGEWPNREMWQFGGFGSEAFQVQLAFDRLRYRLLPYVYSLAGDVAHHGGSFIHAPGLVFPGDKASRTINDSYLFGPSFLVSPVTEFGAREWPVYLPKCDGGWYDFWSGSHHDGGFELRMPAPLSQMPLQVRSGSIVPFDPVRQWTTQKVAGATTLYVYTGADGAFTLYEDDGLSYGYERGEYAEIPMTWNEDSQTLTIGQCNGSFRSMRQMREFRVVWVTPDHPRGYDDSGEYYDASISYGGEAVELSRNR